jgi:hypothetical protein
VAELRHSLDVTVNGLSTFGLNRSQQARTNGVKAANDLSGLPHIDSQHVSQSLPVVQGHCQTQAK